ncbi:serine/threonine-protein kinase [Kibdelosporangium phytohabitans]|uniref:serine/threonine-protein kinase n=1 Tax=Kibdelosporangium phytohabitans TaxID=860235 RepID=UPI0007C67AB3|nr:serine/threonine-protein kinase [Kibdelosporangium phytohabitans]MBE1462465.1 serine/threonine-protein kinase [Kibdelosporangium phytohabitans]
MTAPLSMVNALPQYTVGDQIGSGGMGEVFSGVHRTLGRQVAIKQLPPDMAGRVGAHVQFDREARVLASLDHPHIVPVYDYVQNLLVMEKLDGGTVFDRFHAGKIDNEQACAITLAMLSGLHAAHVAGVLHLDVKPKNLLFNTAGVVKVADFGIAQVISEGATLVTHGGQILGTPAYIAPEQAMGNALSPAADVYAAGTMLYELLTGDLPFDRDRGALALIRQHMFADPKQIEGVPEPLATVVMRSIARELPARYREAEAFATDLASAATSVYGQGWLERSRIPVLHLAPRVVASLATGAAPREDLTVVTPRVDGATADPTIVDPEGPALKRPRVPAWIAAAALPGVVATALLTPSVLSHDSTSNMSVRGAPSTGPAVVDLSKPITVTGNDVVNGNLTLSMTGGGIPLGDGTSQVKADQDRKFSTDITMPPISRWIVGGTVTGELRWTPKDGGPQGIQTFTLRTRQHPLATLMGTGSLLLALFAVAYLESTARTLRRGYRRPSARYSSGLLGALLGLAIWLFTSAMLGHELAMGFGVASVVAGAAGAVCLIVATERAILIARHRALWRDGRPGVLGEADQRPTAGSTGAA